MPARWQNLLQRVAVVVLFLSARGLSTVRRVLVLVRVPRVLKKLNTEVIPQYFNKAAHRPAAAAVPSPQAGARVRIYEQRVLRIYKSG